MKYKILEDNSPSKLEHLIEHHLKEDWKLYGDLKVIFVPEHNLIHGEEFQYIQAIIKM